MSFNTFRKGVLPLSVVPVLMMGLSMPLLAEHPAKQGDVGTTSTGEVEVDLTIPPLIRITDLDNIHFGTYDGVSLDITRHSPACVRTNNATNYSITATSSNNQTDGAAIDATFLLAGGDDFIPYTVTWNAGITESLNNGSEASGFTADHTRLGGEGGDCSTAQRLEVKVTREAMTADTVGAGDYSDTLILMVSPG